MNRRTKAKVFLALANVKQDFIKYSKIGLPFDSVDVAEQSTCFRVFTALKLLSSFISSDNSSPHPLGFSLNLGDSSSRHFRNGGPSYQVFNFSSWVPYEDYDQIWYIYTLQSPLFPGFQLLLPKQTVWTFLERFYAGLTWSENESRTLSCNCWSLQILVLLYMCCIINSLIKYVNTWSIVDKSKVFTIT